MPWFTQKEINSWPLGHKRCRGECGEVKSFSEFHKHSRCLFGINSVCKECRLPLSAENYARQTQEYRLWYRARRRAKMSGIEFSIEVDEINIPDFCPALNIPMRVDTDNLWDSPSLDRLDPKKGYVSGNIAVISRRANTIKNNATSDELISIAVWVQKELQGACESV